MSDREEELIAEIAPDDLHHFAELDGLEEREALEGIVITPADIMPDTAPLFGLVGGTSITADMMLATLKQWGVTFKPYIPSGGTSSSWRTHNRNAQQGNGPYCGVVVHNTAMTASEASQLAYLWRGDGPTSSKPGPLSQFAVGKDGMVWLTGWGTATHSGPGDPDTVNGAKANTLPMSSEITPNTNGTSAGTLRVNPYFFGIEQMHASEGPTAAQHKATVRLVAALLWLLGGPKNGYGAGSVAMHRELTTQRSDPQLVAKGTFRPEVAKVLAAGPTPTPTVTPTPSEPAVKPTTVALSVYPQVVPRQHRHTLTAKPSPAIAGTARFQYRIGEADAWRDLTFGGPATVPVLAGKTASHPNEPGTNADHRYRVIFDPTDPTYATSTSAELVAPVIDLLALRRASQP